MVMPGQNRKMHLHLFFFLLLAVLHLFHSFLAVLFTDLQVFRGAMNFPRKKKSIKLINNYAYVDVCLCFTTLLCSIWVTLCD